MLDIATQIDRGLLVCPRTRQPLTMEGDRLVTRDGSHAYPFEAGVPILVADQRAHARYTEGNAGAMVQEYRSRPRTSLLRRWFQGLRRLGGDHRSPASERAFEEVIARQSANALCVSIGGGPQRAHPNLVNLNIGAFENVDVVGDAYSLPWADGCVDAIHCEAVLEHLEHPDRAVKEMFRVSKPGGEVFAATPFLQAYHAYPGHFQNFTVEGHDALFRRAGFAVVSSGACVGPTFALTDLAALYLRHYAPRRLLGRALQAAVMLLAVPFRLLDRAIHRSPAAHTLASTVFTRARRSG